MKELGRQVYLGGYEHEEHAAEAYDVAALKCKGFKVKTNFDIDRRAASCSTLLTHTQCSPPGGHDSASFPALASRQSLTAVHRSAVVRCTTPTLFAVLKNFQACNCE